MKSNYPRSVDEPIPEEPKPKIWLASLSLALLTTVIFNIVANGFMYARDLDTKFPIGDSIFYFLFWLLAIAGSMAFLSKTSRWKLKDKAKLIFLTAFGTSLVVGTFASLRFSHTRFFLLDFLRIGVGAVILCLVLGVVCGPLWLVARFLNRRSSRSDQALVEFSSRPMEHPSFQVAVNPLVPEVELETNEL